MDNELENLRPEVQGLGPCKMCGSIGYSLSYGGPDICPACDCGANPDTTRLKRELAEARAELLRLARENVELRFRVHAIDATTYQDALAVGRAERAEAELAALKARIAEAKRVRLGTYPAHGSGYVQIIAEPREGDKTYRLLVDEPPAERGDR